MYYVIVTSSEGDTEYYFQTFKEMDAFETALDDYGIGITWEGGFR
jgi:hypothetical protein